MQALWFTRHDSALYDAEAQELVRRRVRLRTSVVACFPRASFGHSPQEDRMDAVCGYDGVVDSFRSTWDRALPMNEAQYTIS